MVTNLNKSRVFPPTKALSHQQACWSAYRSTLNLVVLFRPGELGEDPVSFPCRAGYCLKGGDRDYTLASSRSACEPSNFLRPAFPSLQLRSTQPLPQDRRVYSRTTDPIKEFALETSHAPCPYGLPSFFILPYPSTPRYHSNLSLFIVYFSWILVTPTSSPHFGSIEQCRFAPTLIQIGVFRIHSQPAWQLGVSGSLKFPPFSSLARHCQILDLCCLPIPRFSSAFPPLWPHLPWCFSSRLGSSSLAGSVIERGYCYGRNTHRKQFPTAPSRKQIPDGTLPMAPIRKLNPDGPAHSSLVTHPYHLPSAARLVFMCSETHLPFLFSKMI